MPLLEAKSQSKCLKIYQGTLHKYFSPARNIGLGNTFWAKCPFYFKPITVAISNLDAQKIPLLAVLFVILFTRFCCTSMWIEQNRKNRSWMMGRAEGSKFQEILFENNICQTAYVVLLTVKLWVKFRLRLNCDLTDFDY